MHAVNAKGQLELFLQKTRTQQFYNVQTTAAAAAPDDDDV